MEDEDPRRASYYENAENKDCNSSNNNVNAKCVVSESPTQTHFLNTTVPQNIARQDIGGKHAPTRNSLRHSRMIVMNKSGQVTTDMPIFMQRYKLAHSSRIIVITIGASLSVLSLWLMLWSPNIRSRDNPYWNAGPALVSGISGLYFIKSSPKLYTNRTVPYWIKSLKNLSLASSVLTFITSISVCILSIIHLISLYHLSCAPPNKLNGTCVCRNESTEASFFPDFHYVDLTCFEVNNVLNVFAALTSILSTLLVATESFYLYLHWASRKVLMYARVPVDGKGDR